MIVLTTYRQDYGEQEEDRKEGNPTATNSDNSKMATSSPLSFTAPTPVAPLLLFLLLTFHAVTTSSYLLHVNSPASICYRRQLRGPPSPLPSSGATTRRRKRRRRQQQEAPFSSITSLFATEQNSEQQQQPTEEDPIIDKDVRLLEKERTQLVEWLSSIDDLRSSLEKQNDADSAASIDAGIRRLERNASLLPPVGLNEEDFVNALKLYVKLPLTLRAALCLATGVPETSCLDVATEFDESRGVVSKLHALPEGQLAPQRLRGCLETAQKLVLERAGADSTAASTSRSFAGMDPTATTSSFPTRLKEENRSRSNRDSRKFVLSSIFSDGARNGADDAKNADPAVDLLGRVTRQEGRVATEQDLKTFLGALKKGTAGDPTASPFIVRGTEAIPGGYVIRGINRKSSGKELIDALDTELPSSSDEWPCQVCYVPDFLTTSADAVDSSPGDFAAGDPVLVLLNKDMSPSASSSWVTASSTTIAVVTTFLFAIGVYGSTGAVADRLTEQTVSANGDLTGGLMWFNGKVFEIVLPLIAVQAAHEIGHQLVAWRDNLKLAFPTMLPFWGLPNMGTQTRLEESPKSLSSLFDFAFLGPLFGIASSLALLVYGLQATASLDSDVAQYLPALPARIIQASTLGGSLVDSFLGGGVLAATATSLQQAGVEGGSQIAPAAVPLHPLAVAGFVSLMVQCLELLPLGSTDGGRLSLAILGRQGHFIMGGLTWFALLLASLFGENSDILMGAWIINNLAQNDPEIPCRDEVDQPNFPRALAAMFLWFFAGLVLIPVQLPSSAWL